jgi:hypothetical protein
MIQIRLLAAVVVLLAAVAPHASAQLASSTAGAINGTVTDQSRATVPGVTVTLSGEAVMGQPVAVTDENGAYRFSPLAPGVYTLRFELPGFATVTRENIRVGLGFTATIDVELTTATLTESVVVTGASPVVDVQSTNVVARFDSEQLASLPGSRDVWSVIALAPGISMARMDVGGSGALTQQAYTAYGLTSSRGVNRGMVEGMMINEGGGNLPYLDYSSFTEVALNAVGNTAEMPSPGVFTQLIAKSGGNTFTGALYADYQNGNWQAHNIDDAQIAAGLSGSDVLSARDVNRLNLFRDIHVDSGGYLVRDRLWWYGAYRHTRTEQRYPTLVDAIQETWVPVVTAKTTFNLTPSQKFIGFYTHTSKEQPIYLGAIQISGGRETSAIMRESTVWSSRSPLHVWKLEYNTVLNNALVAEVRGGRHTINWQRTAKDSGQRVEDIGNNFVAGGTYGTAQDRDRPQANGSLTLFKSGWAGSHTFKVGGEVIRETVDTPYTGFGHPSNSLSILNNGVPTQVRLYRGPNLSRNGLWSTAAYATDTWNVNSALTLVLGLRLDRYQPFLPAQTGPDGQSFSAVDKVLVWKNWGPRLGVSYNITGDGRTVLKANYGEYWLYPSADFVSGINPNPAPWSSTYRWSDLNGNGLWDPGEEGALLSSSGGSATETLDPNLENTYTRQTTVYLEREVAENFGVRAGFVWNGRRQVSGQININRPLHAYGAAVTVTDPGPDGRLGTADDGGPVTAYNLSPEFVGLPIVNLTTNIPEADSDYYTWEITATRRESARWSLQASFSSTLSREGAIGSGSNYTPNALINARDGRNVFTTWQAKVSGSLTLPYEVRLVPVFRHQSGQPYARTFVATMNYGNATIRASEFGSERGEHISVFDLRAEKLLDLSAIRTRLGLFFDVYNIFNANPAQAFATNSGASFLRPSAITPPRIARVGVKLDW